MREVGQHVGKVTRNQPGPAVTSARRLRVAQKYRRYQNFTARAPRGGSTARAALPAAPRLGRSFAAQTSIPRSAPAPCPSCSPGWSATDICSWSGWLHSFSAASCTLGVRSCSGTRLCRPATCPGRSPRFSPGQAKCCPAGWPTYISTYCRATSNSTRSVVQGAVSPSSCRYNSALSIACPP